MIIHDHMLLVGEDLFANILQLSFEGIYSFADVSTLDVEEM